MSIFHQVNAIPIYDVAEKLNISIKGKFALCFNGHDRKTASLHFNKNRNLWYCFGCGIGGANLQLVTNCFNCDIPRAISWFQLKFPQIILSGKNPSPAVFVEINRKISQPPSNEFKANPEIYQWILDNTTLCQKAKAYLQNARGYSIQTIERLQIRDICNTADFFNQLKKRWSLQQLLKSGLVREIDKNKFQFLWWDHVLLFPFFAKDGSVIYLQGRFLGQNAQPRYVNLCGVEKPIYNLQALASLSEGDEVYFMEGVTDTISALQDGLPAFGILGASSFKQEYVKEFIRHKIRVIPDNDPAGVKFSNTIIEAFAKVTKHVRVLEIGAFKDYSEFSKAKNDAAVN